MTAGRRLRFGIHLPIFTEAAELVHLGRRIERRGWDGCLLWDHILGSRGPAMPMADPWVVLGALAVSTARIRLGTAVTALGRRHPQKLARETVTVDRLSGGRLVLGVGLGSPVEIEYGAFGEPTDPRVLAERLDESLEVLTGCGRDGPSRTPGRTTGWTGPPSCRRRCSSPAFRCGPRAAGRIDGRWPGPHAGTACSPPDPTPEGCSSR